MSHPVAEPDPVESMMASDAASRALGITLLDYGDGWARATMTVRDDMVNAGADWVDEAAVVDGNLISARTPDDLGPWMKALLAALEG